MKKIICAIMCGVCITCFVSGNQVMANETEYSSQNEVDEQIEFLNEEAGIYAELYNPETGETAEEIFELESPELVGFDDSGNPIIEAECEIEAYVPMMDVGIDNTDEIILPLAFNCINNYYFKSNSNIPKANLLQKETNNDNYGFITCDTKTKTKSDRSVSMSSRKVTIGRSTGSKKSTYYPTSDSFSYNVNWGGANWMAGVSSFGATSEVTLTRGIGGNPWYLTLTCNLSEDDF